MTKNHKKCLNPFQLINNSLLIKRKLSKNKIPWIFKDKRRNWKVNNHYKIQFKIRFKIKNFHQSNLVNFHLKKIFKCHPTVKSIIFNTTIKIFHFKTILLKISSIQLINSVLLIWMSHKFSENRQISKALTLITIFQKNKMILRQQIWKTKREFQIILKILVSIEKRRTFLVAKIRDNLHKNPKIITSIKIRKNKLILRTAIKKTTNLSANFKWNTANNLVKARKLNRKKLF